MFLCKNIRHHQLAQNPGHRRPEVLDFCRRMTENVTLTYLVARWRKPTCAYMEPRGRGRHETLHASPTGLSWPGRRALQSLLLSFCLRRRVRPLHLDESTKGPSDEKSLITGILWCKPTNGSLKAIIDEFNFAESNFVRSVWASRIAVRSWPSLVCMTLCCSDSPEKSIFALRKGNTTSS